MRDIRPNPLDHGESPSQRLPEIVLPKGSEGMGVFSVLMIPSGTQPKPIWRTSLLPPPAHRKMVARIRQQEPATAPLPRGSTVPRPDGIARTSAANDPREVANE